MFKKWFSTKRDGRRKPLKNVKFHVFENHEVNPRYYVNGRYVLPSDNSVVFGQKTLFIHPRRERNLDWLFELEETNRYYNTSPESDPDLCCCPFLKVTSKSFKSKKK